MSNMKFISPFRVFNAVDVGHRIIVISLDSRQNYLQNKDASYTSVRLIFRKIRQFKKNR